MQEQNWVELADPCSHGQWSLEAELAPGLRVFGEPPVLESYYTSHAGARKVALHKACWCSEKSPHSLYHSSLEVMSLPTLNVPTVLVVSTGSTAQLTGMLDSLAAAAARLFSTDSRRTPCRCGRSGLGKLGANLAVTQTISTSDSVKYMAFW